MEKKGLLRFLRQDIGLFDSLSRLSDARTFPIIPLATVLGAVALMPLFVAKSFLALDREARGSLLKSMLESTRRMVVSDTTIQRVLPSVVKEELEEVLLKTVRKLDQYDVLRAPLVAGGRSYRIGIIDGSTMSNHDVVVFDLHGKVDAPTFVLSSAGHGHEFATAKDCLQRAAKKLGPLMPDLIMGDGLYFNEPIATLVHGMGAHFFFKVTTDPGWREVLSNAAFVMKSNRRSPKYRQSASGFDPVRLCSWSMELAAATYAGVPVQIAFVTEHYQKDPRRQPSTFWVLTSALDLSPAELREAAHTRWHIENDIFKRLSHLAGTKRYKGSESGSFRCFLMLLCAAVAAIATYLYILQQVPEKWKEFLGGIKPTWGNILFKLRQVAAVAV